MIHDSYGMPVEVILMMIQYAKSIGRTGYSYISGIAKKWADEEILTVEDAEEYLKRQSRIDDLWRRFRELSSIGNEIPTTKQRQYFLKWNSEYGFSVQMIYLAYERAVEQTGKFSLPYADKVLKSWNEAGLKTEADVAAAEAARAKQKEKAAKPAKKTETVFSQKSSYDLSEIEKLGIKKKKD